MAEYSPDLRTEVTQCGSENISGLSMLGDPNGVWFAGDRQPKQTQRKLGASALLPLSCTTTRA
jgi:hypothetical protein